MLPFVAMPPPITLSNGFPVHHQTRSAVHQIGWSHSGIIQEEGSDAAVLERWLSESQDARTNPDILKEVLDFISSHSVKSVVAVDGIIGCPHEEGKDYPEDEKCPSCTFWATRDRFTGDVIH